MHCFIADYKEALEKGVVPAAYGRLMFLGAGGSGKSSLLDGLMGKPLRVAESTLLAVTQTLSYQWIKTDEDAWKLYSEDDEQRCLAAKSRQLVESKNRGMDLEGSYIKSWTLAPAVKTFSLVGGAVVTMKKKYLKKHHSSRKILIWKKQEVFHPMTVVRFQR